MPSLTNSDSLVGNISSSASLEGTILSRGAPGKDGADGVGVPIGGTTGQVLAKKSDTDYDTEWVEQTGSGTGWTAAQIDLLDSLLSHITYTDAQGGTIANQLIASLRGAISDEPSEVTITESGTTLVISGVDNITSITESGTTLVLA